MLRTSQYLHWPINSYWADDWLLDVEFDDEPLKRGEWLSGLSIGDYAELNHFDRQQLPERKRIAIEAGKQQLSWEEQQRQKQLEKERIAEIEWKRQEQRNIAKSYRDFIQDAKLTMFWRLEKERSLLRELRWRAGKKFRADDPSGWATVNVPRSELLKNPFWIGHFE